MPSFVHILFLRTVCINIIDNKIIDESEKAVDMDTTSLKCFTLLLKVAA